MRINRRTFATAAAALGATSAWAAKDPRPTNADLDKAAAVPVLRTSLFKSPVIIDSVRLLKQDREYFVHVRSRDGAEGLSLANPPRGEYLDKIFKQLIAPFFVGKDARNLENLLWELYRHQDNYKLYGLALWSPQAWIEFAILDMLGRWRRRWGSRGGQCRR